MRLSLKPVQRIFNTYICPNINSHISVLIIYFDVYFQSINAITNFSTQRSLFLLLKSMTLLGIAWDGFRAWLSHYFLCLHFIVSNQTINFLRQETLKTSNTLYRQIEKKKKDNNIWTKRTLLLIENQKISLNTFNRL